MKKSKLSMILSLLLALTLIFAACSSDDADMDDPEDVVDEVEDEVDDAVDEIEDEVDEATDEMGDEITITVAGGAVGQELELTQQAAQMFMDENPNIVVEVLETPDLADDRLGLYLQFLEAESTEVDVYQIDTIWPGDLAEHFVDLYEYGAADVADEHFDPIIQNNTVDGKLVAIPWFTDAGLLYYRTDLLDKYGLEVPTTWDDLEAAAATIQEGERADNPDFWGYVWQGNSYEGLTCDALEWVDSNGGGTVISPDGIITINNDKAKEIVEQAAGWVGTISPDGVIGFGEEDARNMWQAGNAAFMRNWPYAYSLGNAEDSVIAGNFDVATLPQGDSGHAAAALGGWQLAVSKYSAHVDEAAQVAMYLASYDIQKLRAIEGSMNPTIKALYEDEEVLAANPFFGSLYDVFVNATPRPSTVSAPNYNEVSKAFYEGVHSVLSGEENVDDAFLEMEISLQDITGFDVGAPQE